MEFQDDFEIYCLITLYIGCPTRNYIDQIIHKKIDSKILLTSPLKHYTKLRRIYIAWESVNRVLEGVSTGRDSMSVSHTAPLKLIGYLEISIASPILRLTT